jgi:biopolymer transport protein ExbD
MSWKVRHEGSPESVSLTLEEIQQGLVDGLWEPTDEVMGPDDRDWVAIENHPALAELAADIDPPPPPHHEDEARLDMNALIDVCLVLLVFFILTTTVAAMQQRLDAPTPGDKSDIKVPVIKLDQVQEQMIHVTVKMEGGQPVVRIEKNVVAPARLLRELKSYQRASKRTDMLLEHDDEVPHDLVVQVIDAAKGAGLYRIQLVVP